MRAGVGILAPAVARRSVRIRPVGVWARQCLQAPAKAFRRGDIILPVVPGGGLRPQVSCGSGVPGAEARTSPWEGKKLVPQMVFIYENPIRKGG